MATLTELQIELAQYNKAISAVLEGGQSYTIAAGVGGTTRTVNMANLQTIIDEKKNIERQIANKSGTGTGVRLGAGW